MALKNQIERVRTRANDEGVIPDRHESNPQDDTVDAEEEQADLSESDDAEDFQDHEDDADERHGSEKADSDEDFDLNEIESQDEEEESEEERRPRRSTKKNDYVEKGSSEDEEVWNDESDDGDLDNKEGTAKSKPTAKTSRSTRTKASTTRGKRRKEDSSDDDDFEPSSDGKSKRSIQKSSRSRRKRRSSTLDDFIADSDEDSHEDSDADQQGANGGSDYGGGTRKSKRASTKNLSFKEDSSSEIDDDYLHDDEKSGVVATRNKDSQASSRKKRLSQKRSKKNNKRNGDEQWESSDEGEHSSREDKEDKEFNKFRSPSSRGRSPRRSASKAARKLAAYLHDSKNDDQVDVGMPKRGKGDKDVDFELDEEVEGSGSSSDNVEVDGNATDDDSIVKKGEGEVGNVDTDKSFLDADESSEDGEPKIVRTPPSLKLVRTSGRRNLMESHDDGSSIGNDNSKDDDDAKPTFGSPQMPFCKSTCDAITMEKLPKKHICFYSPDGKSKQCFALETLHKIALSGNILYEENKPIFKQPPHFRAPMSADILDQIAHRFGRAAVDVQGPFYSRSRHSHMANQSSEDEGSDDDYVLHFSGRLADDEAFAIQLNRYVSGTMGNRDVYCCPVCYTEAYRRLKSTNLEEFDDDHSDQDEYEAIDLTFKADPLTVLGCIDEDELKIASAFCFAKLVQLKEHLQLDHGLDISGVAGNDLYKRFQIRASDGLLQRYLEHSKKNNRTSRQGEMMSYWHMGNNELFVFLLDLVDRCRSIREEVEEDTDYDEDPAMTHAVTYVDNFKSFWSSFRARAKRIWGIISEPHRKMSQEEINDFVDDDEDVSGDEIPYHLINRSLDPDPTPEEEIVAALRQSRGMDTVNDESSEEEQDLEEDFVNSSDDDDVDPRHYSEEEEEDEWEAGKRKLSLKRGRNNKTRLVEVPRAKVLGGRKRRSNSASPTTKIDTATPTPTSSSKKRRILELSDSDD